MNPHIVIPSLIEERQAELKFYLPRSGIGVAEFNDSNDGAKKM
jgi:hypothetical protein